MVYFIVKHTIVPLLRSIFIKEVRGLENIPAKGCFIIAANHTSYLDPALVWCILILFLNRKLYFIGMKPLQKHWWNRLLLGRYLNTLFVNGVVNEAVDKLKEGNGIIIFPEGGRTYDGELQKPRGTGVAVMSYLANAPVIPLCIDGTFEIWPRYKLFPRIKKRAVLRFGKPIWVSAKEPSQKQIQGFIRTVMLKIAGLCKKRYRY